MQLFFKTDHLLPVELVTVLVNITRCQSNRLSPSADGQHGGEQSRLRLLHVYQRNVVNYADKRTRGMRDNLGALRN